MLKLEDNPPTGSPTETNAAAHPDHCQWWVAHTRARFEKAFAWDLHRRRIPYFLPMVQRVRFSGGRKRRTMATLFPSYVFFCGDEKTRLEAMQTNRVFQTLSPPDSQQLQRELIDIETALAASGGLEWVADLPRGTRCRVSAGPFRDMEGVVIEHKGATRLVLGVSMLGQGAALEIDQDLLEPLESLEPVT